MRLSDIKGERLLDVIADIAEPVANIALDDGVAACFKREECPEGVDPKQFIIRRATKAASTVIKTHKADIITILASIDGVPRDVYAKEMNPVMLMESIKEKATDEVLLDFLSQFVKTEAQEPAGDA